MINPAHSNTSDLVTGVDAVPTRLVRNYLCGKRKFGGLSCTRRVMLPTLPEDLPIVFVAGVMKTQKSSITEPGMRGMGVQHI